MDIDSIDPGADFIEVIEQTVAACDAVLVVIGKQWLTVADAQGRHRIENPEDFVRLEVGTALSRKVRVVPVLVGGAQMPRSDELPEALVGLSRKHALDLPDIAFHQTLGRLIDSLRRDETQAREQAERERLAREAKAREQAEQERLAGEAKAREQREQERLAREATAREQAERARLAREANRERAEEGGHTSGNEIIVPGRIADGSITQPLQQKPGRLDTMFSAARAPGTRRVPNWARSALAGAALAGIGAVVYLGTHSRPAVAPRVAERSALRTGQTKVNPKDGLTYVWIQPGTFTKGFSVGDSECDADEKPPHPVTITAGFWMGQTPVTVGAWKRYRVATGKPALDTTDTSGRKNLNEASGDDAMPAVAMTWDEAKAFCEWEGGRQPTEAEWEYAARAGSTVARYGSLDAIAWYGDNSGKQRLDSAEIWRTDRANYAKRLFENGNGPHPVGQKQANAWNLYDMLGNVWQWTADWYADKYSGNSEADPRGPTSGQYRTLRGGSWNNNPMSVRVSYRNALGPEYRGSSVGFRCLGMRALS